MEYKRQNSIVPWFLYMSHIFLFSLSHQESVKPKPKPEAQTHIALDPQ